MHEQMASLFFMTKENTEEETTICSLGSDIVVNSFKNREQTGQTETKYLCPAVIFALGSFSVLVYSCPLGVQTWSSLCVLWPAAVRHEGKVTKHMACKNETTSWLGLTRRLSIGVSKYAALRSVRGGAGSYIEQAINTLHPCPCICGAWLADNSLNPTLCLHFYRGTIINKIPSGGHTRLSEWAMSTLGCSWFSFFAEPSSGLLSHFNQFS